MLYRVGRFFQFLGLVIVPIGIAGNLAPEPNHLELKTSLAVSTAGMIVFGLGWLIQQAGGKPK